MTIQPIERIAIGFAAVLLAGYFFYDPLYRSLWVLGAVLILALWAVALIVALFAVYWGVTDPGTPALKLRRALAMPLAITAAGLLAAPAGASGRWALARIELMRHYGAFEAQAARTPGQAVAFPYLEGIPDGGVAIVRAAGDPMRLPAARQLALVGETIRQCSPLDRGYFVCAYD